MSIAVVRVLEFFMFFILSLELDELPVFLVTIKGVVVVRLVEFLGFGECFLLNRLGIVCDGELIG